MEYTINSIAKLAGISTRSLRYYDEIDLLKPKRISSNKYRIYSQKEVDRLQQILFYKELDIGLLEIKAIIDVKDFDCQKAMEDHLVSLKKKRRKIETLIINVEKTILSLKGDKEMSNEEKFAGFKKKIVKENDEKYGEEIRMKYGDNTIEESNKKLMEMTEKQFNNVEELGQELNRTLKEAVNTGDPASELAQEVCNLHKEWLTFYWPKGTYSKEAHLSLAQMYCEDDRFKEYYEKIVPNGAEFLKDALKIYCEK